MKQVPKQACKKASQASKQLQASKQGKQASVMTERGCLLVVDPVVLIHVLRGNRNMLIKPGLLY